MSKKMINAENEMPGAGGEMPMGSMNGNSIQPENGEMPAASMAEDPAALSAGLMPHETAEMPSGNMNPGTAASNSGQMPLAIEMPAGSMNEFNSNAFFSSPQSSGIGEMPVGSMNGYAAKEEAGEDKVKTIEIPGSWKLQFTYSP